MVWYGLVRGGDGAGGWWRARGVGGILDGGGGEGGGGRGARDQISLSLFFLMWFFGAL